MDIGNTNSTRIDISPAHRQLMDNLTKIVMDGRTAEDTLNTLAMGILQQGGADPSMRYRRTSDGAAFEPDIKVTLTSEQLLELAAKQAGV